ncbi:hypothetical protein IFM89_004771 [Coptis chinensis]|uniref:type I protein arginine methyltransferase n=1 Tax=Coptis chinensis TaxID=261450 RepID=A0A835LYJ5_9MAGN|nr:hypothetical protein IFM89_004771 [Coptis chinensis]
MPENDFTLISVSQINNNNNSDNFLIKARFSIDSGNAQLSFVKENDDDVIIRVDDLNTCRLFKLSSVESICINEGVESSKKETSYSKAITIQFRTEDESELFHLSFEQWKTEAASAGSDSSKWNEALGTRTSSSKKRGPTSDLESSSNTTTPPIPTHGDPVSLGEGSDMFEANANKSTEGSDMFEENATKSTDGPIRRKKEKLNQMECREDSQHAMDSYMSQIVALAEERKADVAVKLEANRLKKWKEDNKILAQDLSVLDPDVADHFKVLKREILQAREAERVFSRARLENGAVVVSKSKFDDKIEASSAKMYFHYYGQLLHQQNMLQDYVRTGTYHSAVIENRSDFFGRVVVDVGAGSGILSLFAAQAGAKHVYAVEASEMAEYARRLIAGNPSLGERITVGCKFSFNTIGDSIFHTNGHFRFTISGTLLVNERMLETYVIARDKFLVPNGKMFPTIGRMHMAPFSDEYLFVEVANKALFWQQENYYGVDLSPLYKSAFQGYFSQPVVDAFDPRLIVAQSICHTLDFTTMKEEELYEIDIPLKFTASVGTRVHGLACWFDVLFNGSTVQRWLSTAPGLPTTHWYQLRCVLSQPIYVMAGQEITGRLHMVSHNAQSYTMYLTMSAKMWGPGAEQGGIVQTSSCKLDLKEPYYRMSQPQPYAWAQDQQPNPFLHSQVCDVMCSCYWSSIFHIIFLFC